MAPLSDWTDEDPHAVLRTLKRGSEWYSLEKGSGQSIIGAAHMGLLGDYYKRELQRMPPMDIADVAYDRFLANGKTETSLVARPGETVRLRIINGSATTYFHLEFSGSPMQIISADGLDVEPIEEQRFLIGVAETYDVLVRIPTTGSYEFRATAHDGSGRASVWMGTGQRTPARDVPRPNLYHSMGHFNPRNILAATPAGAMGMPDSKVNAGMFDKPGMMDMGTMHDMPGMSHGPGDASKSKMDMTHAAPAHTMKSAAEDHSAGMQPGEHGSMTMSSGGMPAETQHGHQSMQMSAGSPSSGKTFGTNFGLLAADVASSPSVAVDGSEGDRPWPPYDRLRAKAPTALAKGKPVREIRLTLDGDMERYVWLLNNKPLSASDSIRIREGEVARFIMINRTMMHHPMHLHGHFFRVINGQGDYAPLKHTVDVAPMSTTVIEFDANEVGDWFFHCHLLYHMKSGMARMVHYENFDPGPAVNAVRPNLYKDPWYFWGQADILSNMTEGYLTTSNTRNILTAEWEVGWQNVDETELEGIFTYSRYINRFASVFVGANSMGEKDNLDKTRGILGIHYLLPLNIESRAWVDTDSGARFYLDKEFELTPRLMLFGEVKYDTHDFWEGASGLEYMVTRNVSLTARWHSEFQWGGGLQVRF